MNPYVFPGRRRRVGVILMLGCVAQCYGAKIHLESTARYPDSIPIGIVSFKARGATFNENQPWKIIAADLRFSGRFIPFENDSVDTNLFRKNRIFLYIDGGYAMRGSTVTLNCYVRDALNTSPCWSPEGAFIAFTSNRNGRPLIYIMNSDGTGSRVLTYNGDYLDSPAWSPKGDKIAYMSMINGVFQIWTIQTDGTQATQITGNPGSNENPAWSPDGSHIAFSCRLNGRSDLYAVLATGTHLTRLTTTGNAKMPAWSGY